MTETEEVWVDINEVDDDFIAYKISNKGRICSNSGNILKCKGNRVYLLDKQGRAHMRAVGLLVAKAFGLKEPHCFRACYVKHKDGDINNNCIDNLFWSEWRSHADERKLARQYQKRVVLDNKWYERLHKVEKLYGSVAKAPNNDLDWQWVRNKAQGIETNE